MFLLTIESLEMIFMSFMIYLMIALRNFYRSNWFGAFFKAGIITFFYTLFIVPIAFVGLIFSSIYAPLGGNAVRSPRAVLNAKRFNVIA